MFLWYSTSRMEVCLENWKRPPCLCASVPQHLHRQICGKRSSHWSEYWTNQKPFLSGQVCEFIFLVSDPDIFCGINLVPILLIVNSEVSGAESISTGLRATAKRQTQNFTEIHQSYKHNKKSLDNSKWFALCWDLCQGQHINIYKNITI